MGNQTLGRGKLYFDRFVPGTENTTGERYLGNTPSFGLNVETQELEHYSAEEGLRIKDQSITLQVNYTGSFVTDDISLDNVAMFFFGSTSTVSQAAQTAQSDVLNVRKDLYFQLGVNGARPMGVQQVTVSTVTNGATTYVAGTDYVVDSALGRVYIPKTSAIPNGTNITVNYTVAAHSHDLVLSGSDLIYGALRFISYNGVGENKSFYMPKVALRPNGEYALKGEDWQQFGFNTEILKKGTLANIYVDGRAYTP
jgi:hypothetical protein